VDTVATTSKLGLAEKNKYLAAVRMGLRATVR